MKSKKMLLLLAVLFLVILAGAYGLYNRLAPELAPDQLASGGETTGVTTPAETTAPARAQAPDFMVYDEGGNPVRLSDFYGKKPIVLNFWASWCGPCKMEMPDFQAKYRVLGEDVQFLLVNTTSGRETLEDAVAFIQQQGYDFPVFYDTAGEAAAAYAVYSIPATYFIDGEGCLVARATGAIDGETLQRGIDMIRK